MPWGSPSSAVSGYEIEWASAVRVLLMARPASSEPFSSASRAAVSSGVATTDRSAPGMRPMAPVASASDTGFAARFQIASIACETASSAEATVVSRGTLSVSSGSRSAVSG